MTVHNSLNERNEWLFIAKTIPNWQMPTIYFPGVTTVASSLNIHAVLLLIQIQRVKKT